MGLWSQETGLGQVRVDLGRTRWDKGGGWCLAAAGPRLRQVSSQSGPLEKPFLFVTSSENPTQIDAVLALRAGRDFIMRFGTCLPTYCLDWATYRRHSMSIQ